jgi:predicted transcriptional regulator
MERLWFKSNHNDEINLNYLNATTPIKSRGTLLRVINRLVEREWIIKSAIKHGHKYTLDKEAFRQWMTAQVSNETRDRSQTRPEQVLNETSLGPKRDHIDNKDNFIDNVYPDNPNQIGLTVNEKIFQKHITSLPRHNMSWEIFCSHCKDFKVEPDAMKTRGYWR